MWAGTRDCGPNGEIFSFHGKGASVLFMDGHVTFLADDADSIVIRRLVTAAERIGPNAPGGKVKREPVDY